MFKSNGRNERVFEMIPDDLLDIINTEYKRVWWTKGMMRGKKTNKQKQLFRQQDNRDLKEKESTVNFETLM